MSYFLFFLICFFYLYFLIRFAKFMSKAKKRKEQEAIVKVNRCPAHKWNYIEGTGHVCEWCNLKASAHGRD